MIDTLNMPTSWDGTKGPKAVLLIIDQFVVFDH